MNQATIRKLNSLTWVALLFCALVLSGCWEPGQGVLGNVHAISLNTNPAGPKAVQIVFSDNPNQLIATNAGSGAVPASFGSSPPGAGTVASAGFPAQVLYNADGSFLANGPTDTNWPAWITSVELGLTGSNSTYQLPGSIGTNRPSGPNCARFANLNENTLAQSKCNLPGGAVPCGAPSYTFRVSEADCNANVDLNNKFVGIGNGSTNDNVYVRVNLNRTGLGATENLMMIVTYSASSFLPADPNPNDCFTSYNPINLYNPLNNSNFTTGFSNWFSSGGNPTPEACADFAWKTYMRHSKSEGPVQPFATFIPPTYSFVANNPATTSGTTMSTKQIIFPIAGDQNLQVIQLSRSFSTLSNVGGSAFQLACDPGPNALGGGSGASTPNCAGLVLYSITLFRI